MEEIKTRDTMGPEKISSTAQRDYLYEKTIRAKRAILAMEEALNADDARKFVDNMGELQYQERPLIVGSKRLMKESGFTEKDLMMRPLVEYQA